jgi:hypothetical protein
MPELRVTLKFELDGVTLSDMPLISRVIVAEGGAPVIQVFAPDNNSTAFHPIPSITSPNVGVFFAHTDQTLNLNLNAFSAVPLQAGGFILIFGTQLTQATPSTDVQINNPALTGGASANVTILHTGT